MRPRCLRSRYATCGVPVGKSSAWSIAEAGLLVCHANTWFTVTGCALKALLACACTARLGKLPTSGSACAPELLPVLGASRVLRNKIRAQKISGEQGSGIQPCSGPVPHSRAAWTSPGMSTLGKSVPERCRGVCGGGVGRSSLRWGARGFCFSPRVCFRVVSSWCRQYLGTVAEISDSCRCFVLLGGCLWAAHCQLACNCSRKIKAPLLQQCQGFNPLFEHIQERICLSDSKIAHRSFMSDFKLLQSLISFTDPKQPPEML